MGVTLSVFLAGAYVAGGSARAGDDQARLERLAAAAGTGFTDRTAQTGLSQPASIASERQPAAVVPASAPTANPWAAHAPKDAEPIIGASLQKANISAAPFHGGANGNDADCLATAVYYEARGEGQAGQAAVAQVILNRVRHPSYPKSICGVVFQGSRGAGCQFSFACNGAMSGRKESAAWARARQVADRALDGFVMSSVGNATNFHAARVAPGWGGMIRVAQVGQHVFYSFGGRARSMRTFPSAPQAVEPTFNTENRAAAGYRVLGPSAHGAEHDAKLILTSSNPAAGAESTATQKTAAISAAAGRPALADSGAAKTVVLASAS